MGYLNRKNHALEAVLCAALFSILSSCSFDNGSSENATPETSDEASLIQKAFIGGPIIFTEVDPINTVYEDHEGGDAGWVELYNTSTEPVNLQGLHLTKSFSNPAQWTFGDVEIAPQTFMLVYLSGKNLPDYVAPHDSASLIGPGCWTWTDAQNEGVAGESYSEPLDGKSKLCFTENGTRMFGARMRLGENEELGWSSISSFVGTGSSKSDDVLDISATNEILMHAYITKDRKVSFRLDQTGVDDWKGYEIVFTGTGDSSTVYRAILPQGKTFPDLSIIYGTRMSPQSQEKEEVTVKVFSYIARNRGHEPHASFKIKNEAGSLFLMNDSAQILAYVNYPSVPIGKSWSYGFYSGNLDQGAENVGWGYASSSPYSLSSEYVVANRSPDVDTLSALPPSGFYGTPFVVSFPVDENVRCEVGGKAPTELSPVVTELNISSTTSLRCASFVPGAVSGDIANRTYVFETAPSLPAVFLTGDPNSLFDPDTGIYMDGPNAAEAEPHYGANYWEDKEIPIFVELVEKGTSQPAFAENAGLKIFGNYSRANDKKSVAITFREKYGNKRLNYTLFPEFPELTKFKSFVLRNNGGNFKKDYFRDMLSSSLSEGLGVDYQRGRATVVYYNGEYYGIHNLRERSNEYYYETHYGYDPDNIDLLLADNSVDAGSSVDYQAMMDWLEDNHLDSDDNYASVASQIDVDNFMNYVQLEIFVNNRDWPGNNLKKWRIASPASLWKWFIYDTDYGFSNSISQFSNNIFEFAMAEDGDSWPNGPEYTLLLRRLMENPGFKTAFINRMTTLLSMNFDPSRVKARMAELMADIDGEISRDQERWGHNASYMESEYGRMSDFADERPELIVEELKEYFGLSETADVTLSVSGPGQILVHGLPIDVYPMTIKFFPELPVTISAVPTSGGIFAGWSDGETSATRTFVPGENSSFTAVFK